MKQFKFDPKNPPTMTPTQLKALDEAPINYDDIPELGEEFFRAAKRASESLTKQQLTVRLDSDVLQWLKGMGKGYQTRLNRILRAAMENQQHNQRPPGSQ